MTDVRDSPIVVDSDSVEMFRLVEKPLFMPHHCAVTLDREDDQGFVDTGNELPVIGPRIYISVAGVRRLAAFIGHDDPYTLELQRKLDDAVKRIGELERELDEMEATQQAIDRLQRVGFKGQRKPGRKPGDKSVAKNLPHLRDRDEAA